MLSSKSSLTPHFSVGVTPSGPGDLATETPSHTDDVPFLNEGKTITESSVSDGSYILSDYQKERIEQSRNELLNGQTVTQELLQKEIGQFLGLPGDPEDLRIGHRIK